MVRSRQPILWAALVVALVAWSDPGAAQIYHWVDDAGRTHYTDNLHDVPPRYRRDAKDIQDDLRKELLAHEGSAGAQAGARPGAQAPPRPAPPDPAEAGLSPDEAEALAELEAMLEQEGLGKLIAAAGAGMLAAMGVGLLLGLIVVLAFSSLMLIFACRIARTDAPSFGKGMGIAGAQLVANMAISVLAVLLLGVDTAGATTFQSASLGWSFLIYAGVLHGMHGTPFGTALLVSLLALVLTIACGFALGLAVVCAGGLAAVAG